MITSNPPLNQRYHLYKSKLDCLENIPRDLLPTASEVAEFEGGDPGAINRGFKPQTAATGYNQQINNAVIVISRSPQPEEAINQLSFSAKLKQFLC